MTICDRCRIENTYNNGIEAKLPHVPGAKGINPIPKKDKKVFCKKFIRVKV